MDYRGREEWRAGDEQLRASIGEQLAELPASALEAMSERGRALYDRVVLRCEFLNQDAFREFERHPTPQRLAALDESTRDLSSAVNEIANARGSALESLLSRIDAAFDKREAAMLLP